jgi:hypothetical protein
MVSTRSCDGCVVTVIRRLKAFFFRRRSSSSTASSLRGPDGKAVSIVSTPSLPSPREIFPDGCDVTDHLSKGSPTNFRREDITLGTDVDGCVLSLISLCLADLQRSARSYAFSQYLAQERGINRAGPRRRNGNPQSIED